MYKTEASTGLILIVILVLSCLSTSIFNHDQALAQQYIQTIRYRNLVIDLGNGVKTNAQDFLRLGLRVQGKSRRGYTKFRQP